MSAYGIIGFLVSAALMYKVFFKDKHDFLSCVRYYFTPDVWSLLKGEFHQDFFAEGKILLWLGLSVVMGFGIHQVLS